ncbi:beta-galactosidase [Sphingobacterium paramultivorum]|uniref:Beta-galactosidase n=1 Tax=Sphingobacterium paramultivorum TaxID=2886510 RepID=A0A7G5E6Q5_9SPHI|nr:MULTISPECIES: glycoside hydrolase family 2 TIM barrel-domain containing protein [Sphingobacterium]MCS4167639.1 beta-galactosidase [Sphingobacterium sp. BIGb0116]QMV69680.1 beta-galactosidase [Sphingobacterium paramultivorum]WSO13497.1 glycoside hydrolase family 2 TIM barrel-domain containing protein [Sphingobacterium paramultivorum]
MIKKIFYTLIFIGILLLNIQARTVVPFNTSWTFKKGPFSTSTLDYNQLFEGKWQLVNLPHTWNANDMQAKEIKSGSLGKNERFYTGDAYYRKSFVPETAWKGKRIFIRFEGVNTNTEVYVNNQPLPTKEGKNDITYDNTKRNGNYNFVGRHQGGYSAFVFELTTMLQFGKENEILVKVNNEATPQVIPVNHTLFPMYGGIYRPVELIVTDDIHIAVNDFAAKGIYITQKNVSKKTADVAVKIKIDNKSGKKQPIELLTTVFEKDGSIKAKQSTQYTLLPQGRQTVTQQILVKSPHLWQGLDDPYLYKVVTQIKKNNQVIDEVTAPLGLRKFELRTGEGFFLNDIKYPLYGVCRHQDRLGKGSALSNADHDEDLAIIKEMGATSIRLAHYQQSEYFYSKCDSMGLVIWAEIPFVNRVTTLEDNNAQQQLKELIRQNFNHPSIYIWGMHNEVYSPSAYTVELTTKLNDLAKSEDPDRYTVSVSGYNVIDHPVNNNADVQGINHYFGWYNGELENKSDKEDDVASWAKRISEEFKDYRIIFSEYGAEAIPEDQAEEVGNFGNQWSNPSFFPEEYATKFHEVHWGVISKSPIFLGSYVWNTFDFATPITALNVNPRNYKGLVSFDRKLKKDGFYWYKANWSKEPVLYITQRRMINRGNEITPITVYSNRGEPTLIINGQTIKGAKIGQTNVHYIFENVKLKLGKNTVEAKVIQKDGKVLTDTIEWNYDPAFKQGPSGPTKSKTEHVGL